MSRLIAIGGHTGTGKTTLAYGLREACPALSNALIIEDDQIRREILGYDLKTVMTDTDYLDEVSYRVREEVKARTLVALSKCQPVINASGFFSSVGQEEVTSLTPRFVGLWLVADRQNMVQRIQCRNKERAQLDQLSLEKGHASDADEGVIDKFGDLPQPAGWHVIDANLSSDQVYAMAKEIVET